MDMKNVKLIPQGFQWFDLSKDDEEYILKNLLRQKMY